MRLPRVALVEDNPDNRLLVELILAGRCELTAYEDGPEAIAGIGAGPPDLVLLDISLPGMDGLEVLARLRATDTFRVPVIALTAHAMAGDRERFADAGFDGYVAKPIVDEEELLAAMRRFVPHLP